MPASGKEEGSEEGRGPRERATPQPGREKAGLGEGEGFLQQLHAEPAPTRLNALRALTDKAFAALSP